MRTYYTSNALEFYVDDDMAKVVEQYKWNACSKGYVRRTESKTGKTIMLHAMVLPPTDGLTVDHIDRNPANNCRSNLRLATRSQQRLNNNSPGVTLTPKGWWARVQFKGVRHDLGYFDTRAEAIQARDDLKMFLW